MQLRVREVIKMLENASVVTLPGNSGKEPALGTLNAILKKAGLK
jgi:predicted RNA binding protein YcfA (HicA-like mRNA interferase family)